MIVIADTSPLSYLIRLGHVGVLQSIYGQVVVPPAVLNEILHPYAQALVLLWFPFGNFTVAVEEP
jgi:predicted nucleic acid-binding protein